MIQSAIDKKGSDMQDVGFETLLADYEESQNSEARAFDTYLLNTEQKQEIVDQAIESGISSANLQEIKQIFIAKYAQ